MQVILKEDVVNLGYKDDIVTVKDGYGRNFLIPQGKAVIASDSAKKVLAENLKQRAHKLVKLRQMLRNWLLSWKVFHLQLAQKQVLQEQSLVL